MGEGSEHNPFAPPAEHADIELPRARYEPYNLAGYGQRVGGALLDGLLSVFTAIPGLIAFMALAKDDRAAVGRGVEGGDEFQASMLLIFVGPLLLGAYQWYLVTKTGQTLAKRWLRMRIVREDSGALPGFVHGVLLRNWLFVAASAIPFVGGCIGLCDPLAIFFGERRQTLHDRVAGTVVVQE
jgi:uncharacterized RDD family membrane protein YckC